MIIMKYLKFIGMGLGFIIYNWSPFSTQVFADKNGSFIGIVIMIAFIGTGFMIGKLLEEKK